jgi:predicted nucleic acid-binding protein
MIVVADTSVILNLCRVQHERLLLQLFRRVLIPERVASEFARLLIPSVAGVLDRLEKEAGFWGSSGLRAKVLQAAGE